MPFRESNHKFDPNIHEPVRPHKKVKPDSPSWIRREAAEEDWKHDAEAVLRNQELEAELKEKGGLAARLMSYLVSSGSFREHFPKNVQGVDIAHEEAIIEHVKGLEIPHNTGIIKGTIDGHRVFFCDSEDVQSTIDDIPIAHDQARIFIDKLWPIIRARDQIIREREERDRLRQSRGGSEAGTELVNKLLQPKRGALPPRADTRALPGHNPDGEE